MHPWETDDCLLNIISQLDGGCGFENTIIYRSDWSKIKDEKFHELRNKYIESRKNLHDYLCEKYIEAGGD